MPPAVKLPPRPAAPTPASDPVPEPASPPAPAAAWKYPKVVVAVRDADHPEDGGPIFAAEMMELVGWEEEPPDAPFGDDYDLYDANGNKVRLRNNGGNRYHEYAISERYAYEILNRNWAGPTCFPGETVNGESMDFSRTGLVKSGQHRGAGLILAKQLWERDERWKENWPTEPCLETVLVLGVSDDARVTRTYDTGRPRTGADTLYSSGRFLGDIDHPTSRTARRNYTKVADKAIKHLWEMTGAAKPGDTPHRTQTEIEKFFGSHPWIETAVRFVVDNNKPDATGQGPLAKFGDPGAVAAMMYLMAAGKSKRNKYKLLRSEAGADFTNKDKAIDFWLTLAQGGMKPVRDAVYPVEGDDIKDRDRYRGKIFPTGKNESSPAAYKKAQLASAWFAYLSHGADGVTPARVRLKFFFKTPGGVPEVDPETNAPVIDPKTGKQRMVVGPDEPQSYDDVLFGGIELQERERDGTEGTLGSGGGGDDDTDTEDTPRPPTGEEMYRKLEADYKGEVLVLYVEAKHPKTGKPDPSTAHYRALGTAADEFVKAFKVKYTANHDVGVNQVWLSREEWILKKVPATLVKAGKTVREITKFDVDDAGYYVVTESKVYGPKDE